MGCGRGGGGLGGGGWDVGQPRPNQNSNFFRDRFATGWVVLRVQATCLWLCFVLELFTV